MFLESVGNGVKNPDTYVSSSLYIMLVSECSTF